MNCTHIEKLLPLYVEGDLDTQQAEMVLTHLDACPKCQERAAEYEESQNWLRSYSPPQFDETFFEGLRQSVQSEIARAQRRPNFFQLIVERWGWQPVMAAAMALLVIVSGLVLYARFNRTTVKPTPNGEMVRQTPKPQSTSGNQPVEGNAKNDVADKGQPSKSRHQPIQSVPQELPKVGAPLDTELPSAIAQVLPPEAAAQYHDAIATSKNAATALENLLDRFSKPEAVAEMENPDAVLSAPTDATPARGVTRIEMQTANPKVRIIWLAPKETDSQSNKTSRNTN